MLTKIFVLIVSVIFVACAACGAGDIHLLYSRQADKFFAGKKSAEYVNYALKYSNSATTAIVDNEKVYKFSHVFNNGLSFATDNVMKDNNNNPMTKYILLFKGNGLTIIDEKISAFSLMFGDKNVLTFANNTYLFTRDNVNFMYAEIGNKTNMKADIKLEF